MRKSVALHKKSSISSVTAASCGFGNIYWRVLDGKLSLMGSIITFHKAGGVDKGNNNTYWISLTYHMSNMIRWDIFINRSHLQIRQAFSLLFSLVAKIAGLLPNISICNLWQHLFILANLGESFTLCINRSSENLSGLGMTVPNFMFQKRKCWKRLG